MNLLTIYWVFKLCF